MLSASHDHRARRDGVMRRVARVNDLRLATRPCGQWQEGDDGFPFWCCRQHRRGLSQRRAATAATPLTSCRLEAASDPRLPVAKVCPADGFKAAVLIASAKSSASWPLQGSRPVAPLPHGHTRLTGDYTEPPEAKRAA